MKLLGIKIVARVALAILALSGALGAMKVANSGQADAASKSASSSINYVVDGPLWLHPDSPTVHSTVTDLIPTGGEFDIQCFALGDNVIGDTAWDFGTNPATGDTGYVSDYYVNTNDTQGNEATQLPQEGIPECGSGSSSNSQTEGQQSNAPKTAFFFSGTTIPTGVSDLHRVAGTEYYGLNDWASGNCTDTKVAQIIQKLPPTVSTLAGWSRGRLGILYFLQAATDEQKAQIHTIILFDPGDSHDFGGYVLAGVLHVGDSCDWKLNPNALLASWLQSNPQQNRLIAITGQDSEEKELAPGGNSTTVSSITSGTAVNTPQQLVSTYAGLWQYYFADVWNTTVGAQQVQVCDYDGLSHEDILRDYYTSIQNPPSNCLPAPDQAHPLTQWHP
jgi:hypothetical protein